MKQTLLFSSVIGALTLTSWATSALALGSAPPSPMQPSLDQPRPSRESPSSLRFPGSQPLTLGNASLTAPAKGDQQRPQEAATGTKTDEGAPDPARETAKVAKDVKRFAQQNKDFSITLLRQAKTLLKADQDSPQIRNQLVQMLSTVQVLIKDPMSWQLVFNPRRPVTQETKDLARKAYQARQDLYKDIKRENEKLKTEALKVGGENLRPFATDFDHSFLVLNPYFYADAALKVHLNSDTPPPAGTDIKTAIDAFKDQNQRFAAFLCAQIATLVPDGRLSFLPRAYISRTTTLVKKLTSDPMAWGEFLSAAAPKEKRDWAWTAYRARRAAYDVITGFEKRGWYRLAPSIQALELYFDTKDTQSKTK